MGWHRKKSFRVVEDKIARNTKLVLDMVKNQNMLPRDAAEKIARERVL